MDEDDHHFPPSLVSLSPIPLPSRRRLSASFVRPSPPLSSPAPLAWISLQGRLLNAEEATSQTLSWHLFTPIQRFLIVAVIGVAVADSRKNHHIWQLNKSVQLRDEVLSSMQQKLDSLCQQLNYTQEHSIAATNKSFTKNGEFADCKCWPCDQHCDLFNAFMGSSVTRLSCGNEVLNKMAVPNEEQEERRMSDLSDWASSVTSAADIQLSSLAIEQDFYNLKRDCEEKDTTIKELTTLLNSSELAKSKRAAELEDIIGRKNTTITKLKKDLVVLEQKVMQLSRLRRPSFSACDSHGDQLAHVRDNLLYNMDSSTSPSSSDSDSTPLKDSAVKVDVVHILNRGSASASSLKSAPVKPISSSGKALEQHLKSRSLSPLQEISANRKFNTASSSSSSRPKQLSAREDLKKSRRRFLSGTKNVASQKRWV